MENYNSLNSLNLDTLIMRFVDIFFEDDFDLEKKINNKQINVIGFEFYQCQNINPNLLLNISNLSIKSQTLHIAFNGIEESLLNMSNIFKNTTPSLKGFSLEINNCPNISDISILKLTEQIKSNKILFVGAQIKLIKLNKVSNQSVKILTDILSQNDQIKTSNVIMTLDSCKLMNVQIARCFSELISFNINTNDEYSNKQKNNFDKNRNIIEWNIRNISMLNHGITFISQNLIKYNCPSTELIFTFENCINLKASFLSDLFEGLSQMQHIDFLQIRVANISDTIDFNQVISILDKFLSKYQYKEILSLWLILEGKNINIVDTQILESQTFFNNSKQTFLFIGLRNVESVSSSFVQKLTNKQVPVLFTFKDCPNLNEQVLVEYYEKTLKEQIRDEQDRFKYLIQYEHNFDFFQGNNKTLEKLLLLPYLGLSKQKWPFVQTQIDKEYMNLFLEQDQYILKLPQLEEQEQALLLNNQKQNKKIKTIWTKEQLNQVARSLMVRKNFEVLRNEAKEVKVYLDFNIKDYTIIQNLYDNHIYSSQARDFRNNYSDSSSEDSEEKEQIQYTLDYYTLKTLDDEQFFTLQPPTMAINVESIEQGEIDILDTKIEEQGLIDKTSRKGQQTHQSDQLKILEQNQ